MFAVVVCIGNESTYAKMAKPGILRFGESDTLVIELRDQSSLHLAYNRALETLRGLPDLEGVLLIHEDLEIRDPELFRKLRTLFQDSSVAIVGAMGAVGVTSLSWWLGQRRGVIKESRFNLAHPHELQDVDSLDGCFMALSPWSVANLKFDPDTFSGFHGYDADICFSARALGKRVLWEEFDLFHHTKGGYGDFNEFIKNDEAFREKWIFSSGRSDRYLKPQVNLEIGGGTKCRDQWINLDPVHGVGEFKIQAQLTPWPFETNSVSNIFASHVLEHIPAGAPRISVMNECYRVLEPGGSLEIRVPCFPHPFAVADPTHVSFWVESSILYFTGDLAPDAEYGVEKWQLGHLYVVDGWELRALLIKPF